MGEASTDSTVNDLVRGKSDEEREREKGGRDETERNEARARELVCTCVCQRERESTERRNVRGLCTLPFPLAVTDGIMWSGHCHHSACLLRNPLRCASLTEEPQSRRT